MTAAISSTALSIESPPSSADDRASQKEREVRWNIKRVVDSLNPINTAAGAVTELAGSQFSIDGSGRLGGDGTLRLTTGRLTVADGAAVIGNGLLQIDAGSLR
ncbi:MAG: hypothetical protein ABIN96_03105 [Rubrivivax sp.]